MKDKRDISNDAFEGVFPPKDNAEFSLETEFNEAEYNAWNKEMAEVLQQAALRETPRFFSRCIAKLLDVKAEDCLIDLWANYYNVLPATFTDSGRADYIAVDTSFDSGGYVFYQNEEKLREFKQSGNFITETTAEGSRITYYLDDPFNFSRDPRLYANDKTLKIYVHTQLGEAVKDLFGAYPNATDVISDVFGTTRSVSEWHYVAAAIKLLGDAGKACCLVSGRALWGEKSIEVRRALIEKGLVEAVVLLPQAPFRIKGQEASFVVLSRGNDAVHFLDMSSYSNFSEDASEQIDESNRFAAAIGVALKHSQGDNATMVSYKDIEKYGYTFDPRNYLQQGPFGFDVSIGYLKHANRGIANRLAAELKSPLREAGSSSRAVFISLGDYRHGEFFSLEQAADRLDYYSLTDKEKTEKKYRFIRGPRLIIARVGFPFKVALLTDEYDEDYWQEVNFQAVLSDNLLSAVIPDDFNPIYVLAFFRSIRGQELLRNAAHPGAQLQLSAKNLETIPIPLPDTKTQGAIAAKYEDLQAEELSYLTELEQLNDSMNYIFGSE